MSGVPKGSEEEAGRGVSCDAGGAGEDDRRCDAEGMAGASDVYGIRDNEGI